MSKIINSTNKKYPVLSYPEECALFYAYHQGMLSKEKIEEKLTNHNIGLIISIAKPLHQKYQNAFTLNDLITWGYEGIVKSIELFDINRGLKFATYATHWIEVKMMRGIHENYTDIRLPEHKYSEISRIFTATEFILGNNEEVTDKKILNYIKRNYPDGKKYTLEKINELKAINNYSFENPEYKSEDGETTKQKEIFDNHNLEEIIHDKLLLKKILNLSALTPREKYVINKRFIENKTLQEIGKLFNMSRQRVQQNEVTALKKMKRFAYAQGLYPEYAAEFGIKNNIS